MKKIFKPIMLSICILFLSLSTSYAALDGQVCYLYVKGPARIWTPTIEFEGGNNLLVIGASHEYGVLNGVWQEVPLGFFSFLWAQVEKDEPTTTTTIPDEIPLPSSLGFQPAQTEKTKFLINLWGLVFPLPEVIINPDTDPPTTVVYSILIGSGSYLTAFPASYIGITSTPGEGSTPAFGSLSPPEGEQESTVEITITGVNTTFEDDGIDEILFSPEDGLTVENRSTEGNTVVKFDLIIAADAPLGPKTVTVIYDDGTKFITGANVFEVIAKTTTTE
jgi:hypothetical protein